MIWSDFDPEDISKIDSVITCKLPKYDPYVENNENWNLLRDLSSKYMTHKCTTRCKGEDMKNPCSYGYPKNERKYTEVIN